MTTIDKILISDLEKEHLPDPVYKMDRYNIKIVHFSWQHISDIISENKPHLYLLDYTLAIEQNELLTKISNQNNQCAIAIYNAPEQTCLSELVHLCQLRGYFYAGISERHFLNGMESLLSGGYSIPIELLEQLLNYYQSVTLRFGHPFKLNLTHREQEVLRYLKQGVSNTKLADELFISEHTVKTHLYRIFRKLDIHNRNQAIEWAHKYLP